MVQQLSLKHVGDPLLDRVSKTNAVCSSKEFRSGCEGWCCSTRCHAQGQAAVVAACQCLQRWYLDDFRKYINTYQNVILILEKM